MSTPIGKQLLQLTPIPLDVIKFCIEPYLAPSKEELKQIQRNRKNVIMELEWHYWYHSKIHAKFRQPKPSNQIIVSVIFSHAHRRALIDNIRDEYFGMLLRRDPRAFLPWVERIYDCNRYVHTIPFPKIVRLEEDHRFPPKTCFDKILSLIGCCSSTAHKYSGVRVNLKTKEVSFCFTKMLFGLK